MEITHDILYALAQKYNYGDIDWASKYGEPGYSTDKKGIVLSNWNKFPKHVTNAIEKQFELEWSDEWIVLHNNGSKCYRTSADSYCWTPSIHYLESVGDYVPVEETGEYLEDEYVNTSNKYYPGPEDVLTDAGFEKQDTIYESGSHPGQTDDPKKVLKQYEDTYDVVFTLDHQRQFDCRWSVWLRSK